MATLLLGAAGTALGAGFGGTILGLSGATIGGMVGSAIGSVIDSAIVQSLTPGQRIEGAKLDSIRVTSSTEGAVIPRLFGRMRMGGNLIWATDFVETQTTTSTGGKGGGPTVTTTNYYYSCSFAVALCEGPIAGIGRIWADGQPLDPAGITMRIYKGTETQTPDPLIVSMSGAEMAPAYRGTAYVVFENLALTNFGNRIPQVQFEVFAAAKEGGTSVEALLQGVTIIPGAGEFALATEVISTTAGGSTTSENCNATAGVSDFVVSMDQLESAATNLATGSLVVGWFGDDLRCGSCEIKPKVDQVTKNTSPKVWAVDGINRAGAELVSSSGGTPAYGGTPADFAVVEAIGELKDRGLGVTFYPFLFMDIPAGNTLPNPYSNGAAGTGQAAYPWRGRITCSPAPGFTGTVDKTSTAATQVAAFFGSATESDFTVSGTTVTYTGAADWGFRRMILHYALLCAASGFGAGDSFLIGSEMVGLMHVRSSASAYPAVTAMKTLLADVRAILGPSVQIGYAADWSEYFGHQPGDGTGDVYFHLDPLWSDAECDFVGIDNYMPIADWRDGTTHLDALAGALSVYDVDYLQANIEGGEGYDWYYASSGARDTQTRTTITDGAYGKPWVFRFKDVRNWWLNQHFNRPGGVQSGSPTAWVAQSKPIRFTEFGCPAIDRGANQPNVFVDSKSSESAQPYYSRGWRDDTMQRAYLGAVLGYWGNAANNPDSTVYGDPMIDLANSCVWTWDARPYPQFPALTSVWGDAPNWTLGHWITGRLGGSGLSDIVAALCEAAGLSAGQYDVASLTGSADGFLITAIESPRTSIGVLMRYFGFDAVEVAGVIRFVQRGQLPSVTLTPDDMVAAEDEVAEPFEQTRQQTTDLPQILKWQVMRSDEEYDPAPVEARRSTAQSRRTTMENFPLAVPPEDAKTQADRALFETWVGIEGLACALPPSRMGIDPCDVIAFQNDGRTSEFRITSRAEAETIRLDAVAQDRFAYGRAPGVSRPASVPSVVTYGQPNAIFLNLPQLAETTPDYQPYIAADSDPWPGSLALERSPTTSGYVYVNGINRRAKVGTLFASFAAGPTDRWDDASECVVDLDYGTLGSISDALVLEGQNAFAVETGADTWEIFQAGTVTLVAPGRYSLTHLLRGQRGTEYAMGNPAPSGSRFVVLDMATTPVAIASTQVGLAANWLVGPAMKPISDPSFLGLAFTPSGAGLRCFSPEPVEDPAGFTPGDFTIAWIRRDRSLDADQWEDGEIPMSEASESYSLEIYDGATLKRTVATTSPSFLYTSAMQSADLGAPLAAGDTLAIKVYQISARVGRGIPLVHTIQF